jgi:hypothetical protein
MQHVCNVVAAYTVFALVVCFGQVIAYKQGKTFTYVRGAPPHPWSAEVRKMNKSRVLCHFQLPRFYRRRYLEWVGDGADGATSG